MKASDIAKLAAGVAAGDFTASAVRNQLSDGDCNIFDSLLAVGTGSLAGVAVSKAMDITGASDLIDSVVEDLFDW
jgi:hypothetical protein